MSFQEVSLSELTLSSRPLFIVSDGTGETAQQVIQAVLTQYENLDIRVVRYKRVLKVTQVDAILDEARIQNAALLYTFVSSDLRVAMKKGIQERSLDAVDVLGPVLELFGRTFEDLPSQTPGLLHEVNEKYFRRIEAMEFAVKQDDGSSPENLKKSDLILVGVSRTSKTPLSIFLSHKGWKVANVPLVYGIEPPQELFEVDQNRIVALIIQSDALAEIRRQRLVRMGKNPLGDYASMDHIQREIEWSRQVFSRNRLWPVFDVTGKALEETASEIERRMRKRVKKKDS